MNDFSRLNGRSVLIVFELHCLVRLRRNYIDIYMTTATVEKEGEGVEVVETGTNHPSHGNAQTESVSLTSPQSSTNGTASSSSSSSSSCSSRAAVALERM